MSDLTLGVDLSDLIARLAVVDGDAQVLSRAEVPPGGSTANGLRDAARRAIAGARGSVTGIGVATAAAGEAVPPEITAALRDASSRDTEIVTIAAGTAAAMAEQWCGAARGLRQVVTIAIAEHVTSGVLINGAPWLGAHGFASSVAWLAMNPVEREDYRRYGGLEAEIASAGIVRRFVWRIKSGDESVVADRVHGDFTKIVGDDIFEASRAGDGVSISVVRDTAKYIGMAVANLVTMFDPEMIVLGGVIAHWGDQMLEAIKVECARRLQPQQAELVRIVLSTLGNDAVAIGAARAAARAGA
jgi:predicted NBD/HSP70 family sugar kinase